ncbi:MAG: hypothetical protein JRM80_14270 [Nitrososphaerota archaeon]|nr:hypothetical protein [Nitrososphaerota archaeon]
MIETIRRRLSRTPAEDPWATDLTLKPEITEVSELRFDDADLTGAGHSQPQPSSNDVDLKGYYKGVILTAIEHGGTYQGQQISIPWLRMTLAGLEKRPMPPELMWGEGPEGPAADMPGFEEFFPDQRLAP